MILSNETVLIKKNLCKVIFKLMITVSLLTLYPSVRSSVIYCDQVRLNRKFSC